MPQFALAGAALLALLMLGLALRPAKPVATVAPETGAISQSQREAAQRELAQAMNRFASLTNPTPNVPITEAPKATQAMAANQPAPLTQADMRRLAEKAAQAVRDGDIMGARVILERAIEAGDPTAILALAQTHDPRVLDRMGVRGIKGDPSRARALYQQASEKGLKEASTALAGLTE
jgi:TPR repeat protein